MKTTKGIIRRLPVKGADGSIDLIEIDGIFYLEAQGEDTLIRTKRKKTLQIRAATGRAGQKTSGTSVRALPSGIYCQFESSAVSHPTQLPRLRPSPRTVFALVSFAASSPPVNRRIPIARNRFENIRKILGV